MSNPQGIIIADASSNGSNQFRIKYDGRKVAVGVSDNIDANGNPIYKKDKKFSTKENGGMNPTLDCTCASFNLLQAIAGKDHDMSNFSKEDMAYARTLKGKTFGATDNLFTVHNIKPDEKSGKTIFELVSKRKPSEKSYVEIDFETDEEKYQRENPSSNHKETYTKNKMPSLFTGALEKIRKIREQKNNLNK